MNTRRKIIIAACTLLVIQIVIQTLAIATWNGSTAAALVSDLVQGGLGFTCLLACFYARSTSGKASSYHWTWLALSFIVFIVAQSLAGC